MTIAFWVSSVLNIQHCKHLTVYAFETSVANKQETSTRQKVQQLKGHTHQVVSCCVDENEHRLLSGSWDKQIVYWDFNKPEKLVKQVLTRAIS